MQPWWINLEGWAAADLSFNGKNRWAFPAGSALRDFRPLWGAGVGGDRVEGLVVFELVGKGGHHAPERGGLGGGEISLFEGVVAQMEKLVVRAAGDRGGEVVINDLPRAFAETGPVGGAVGAVRVVHEERLRPGGVGLARQQAIEAEAVNRVGGGGAGLGQGEECGEKIHDGGGLGLEGARGDGEAALMRVGGIGLRPRSDERDAHPTLVMGAFFAAEWGGAGDGMLMAEGRIGAIVAQKDDEGVLRDAERLEVVEEVAEGFVHALDQRGEGLGVGGFARILVVSGEARIGLEGRVDGVVGEVEEERLPLLGGSGDEVFGFQRERFGTAWPARLADFLPKSCRAK